MPGSSSQGRPSARVLVVEANPITRLVLHLSLEGAGYRTLEAATCPDALQKASHSPPALVLICLDLPEADVLGLIQGLQRPGKQDPILVGYSGYPARLEAYRGSKGGFAGFLARPFLPSHLVYSVRFYLQKRADYTEPVPVHRAALSRESYSEKARKSAEPQKQRILVVDDHDPDREELAGRLSSFGFQVTQASGGVAAIGEALKNPPAAIVSDSLMPGMDGFELCLTCRLIHQLALVPLLITPAGAIEEIDRWIAHRIGASAVVSRKPDFHKVIDALRSVLDEEPPSLAQTPAALPSDRRQILLFFKE